jgi:hypothetical protein
MVEQTRGPWRVAIFDEMQCPYEPVGSLSREHSGTTDPPLGSEGTATVEVRRAGGGLMPWAMLGGAYKPKTGESFRIDVPHSGPLSNETRLDCVGPLGRQLNSGLPLEFAEAVAVALVAPLEHLNRPGRIRVLCAAYDVIESSAYIFGRAAELLKWALLSDLRYDEAALADLSVVLDDWVET